MITYKYINGKEINICSDSSAEGLISRPEKSCMWSPWHLAPSLLLAAALSAPKLWLAWKVLALKSQIGLFNKGLAICFAVYGELMG